MQAIRSLLGSGRLLTVFRIIVGLLFALAGFLKLLVPTEEFAAQIKTYQVITGPLADFSALVIPWFQLIFGVLLLVGVFRRISLGVVTGMLALFMPIVASTIIRGLNLEDCGCFGSIGIKETPPVVLIRDSITLLMALTLWRAWGIDPRRDLQEPICFLEVSLRDDQGTEDEKPENSV